MEHSAACGCNYTRRPTKKANFPAHRPQAPSALGPQTLPGRLLYGREWLEMPDFQ